jgi:hypothetical protein
MHPINYQEAVKQWSYGTEEEEEEKDNEDEAEAEADEEAVINEQETEDIKK